MKQVICSSEAPAAIGPYSQAILHDSKYTMEMSGQLGINPATGKLVEGGIDAQMKQTMKNIEAVLAEAGWDFSNIVKTRIFLAYMEHYGQVNEIYGGYFPENPPARLAIAAKELPLKCLVEIECVAVGDEIKG